MPGRELEDYETLRQFPEIIAEPANITLLLAAEQASLKCCGFAAWGGTCSAGEGISKRATSLGEHARL